VLVPALLGSPYAGLDPELRKSFEVALHLGTAGALLLALRAEVAEVVNELSPRQVLHVGLTLAPAAALAMAAEETIERRLGAVGPVAVAQIAAAAALAGADRRPATRRREASGALDHLVLGLAQATALAPGVSRNGATLTAARLRRFARPAAARLSREAALPVILGAAALKGVRMAQTGLAPELRPAFLVGTAASFGSSVAARGLLGRVERARSYRGLVGYRMTLGALALVARALRRP
jgi:undecaprenyl-diphosphatase